MVFLIQSKLTAKNFLTVRFQRMRLAPPLVPAPKLSTVSSHMKKNKETVWKTN